ncbi:phosphate ABC transporter substrate-binding protein [Candidatus Poribacteria bacterium]|nr:phosphate ABC transporter substrate-binding protein [Candidatus Poribacteria bacterium]
MPNHLKTASLALALLAATIAVGCSKGEGATSQRESSGMAYLTIKGSDTMVNLCSAWAEAFMKSHPDVDVSVTGGGSGTGIAALLNQTTDICASSRDLKESELAQAKQRGVTPVAHTVGSDGLAVAINSANPVSELTLDQLKKIFTGAYTKWTDTGGGEEPILVLSRENNSGTYVFFQEHVLQKEDFRADARLMTSSAAIVQALQEDESAIGYCGVAYVEKAPVRIVSIKKDASSRAVAPTVESVQSGEYPISRPLYLLTNGDAADGPVRQFLDFCNSPEGQKIVLESGYVPKSGQLSAVSNQPPAAGE